jgi:hypothetical protein
MERNTLQNELFPSFADYSQQVSARSENSANAERAKRIFPSSLL